MLSRGEEDGEDDARNSSEVQWQEGEWRKKRIDGKEKRREEKGKRDGRRKEEYEEKKKRKRHPSHIYSRTNSVKHSLWSDLISSGWPSAYWPNQLWSLRMSRSILPVSSSFLLGSAAKQAQWLAAIFLLFLFFFASSILLSFRSCVDLLNTAILRSSSTMENRPIRKYPRFWASPGQCCVSTSTVSVSWTAECWLVFTAVLFLLGCQSSYVVDSHAVSTRCLWIINGRDCSDLRHIYCCLLDYFSR